MSSHRGAVPFRRCDVIPIRRPAIGMASFSNVVALRWCRAAMARCRHFAPSWRHSTVVAQHSGSRFTTLGFCGTRRAGASRANFPTHNPNPQFVWSCRTCAAFGSPRVFVSRCKTNSRSAVTARGPKINPLTSWIPTKRSFGKGRLSIPGVIVGYLSAKQPHVSFTRKRRSGGRSGNATTGRPGALALVRAVFEFPLACRCGIQAPTLRFPRVRRAGHCR